MTYMSCKDQLHVREALVTQHAAHNCQSELILHQRQVIVTHNWKHKRTLGMKFEFYGCHHVRVIPPAY